MATPENLSPTLPPGLPDPAALARLAGEFFAALPGTSALGGVPVPTNPQPPGFSLPPGATGPATPAAVPLGALPPGANLVPTSPQTLANAGASAPALVPHAQAPTGVPDHALGAAPGYDGRAGSYVAGVPQAYAAASPAPTPALPGGSAPAAFTPTAYYFLDEGGVPGVPASGESSLPSGETLRWLLADDSKTPALPAAAAAPGVNLVPTSPQSLANAGASAPALVPHAQGPNDMPDHALGAAPGYDGRAGSYAAGVPQAYAAALPAPTPAVPGGGAAAAVTPAAYYFLDEGGVPGVPASGEPPLPAGDLVSAQSFAMPGSEALRSLFGGDAKAPALPAAAAAPGASPGGSFYFVDAVPAASGAGRDIPQVSAGAHPLFDVHAIRRDFPILQERVNGRPLVWFDNAATTQKPQAVIDRLSYFYAHENSNIHRAAHELAARATDAYEQARETVRRFLGASSPEEIIFVRGTTEAINLVAKSWGAKHVGPGDEIIVSHLEHHANIVPWQQLAGEKGAKIRVIPVDDSGQVLLEEYQRLLGDRTKIVAVTQVSNALGTVVPVQKIVELAHRAGARALVDGAQSVSHMRVDMRALDADFFVFSGHKIYGPTGIGVVYGKREVLEDMPPWQGGGNMITDVTFERTLYQEPPGRFEAGTGNIADAVGLGTALDYLERLGIENVARYEHALLEYATHHMRPIPGVRLIGTAKDKASVLSFVLDGTSPEEVAKALNQEGIAVRAGHHCAQPILRRFGLEATVRPSLAFYNTCEEVDRMVAVVRRLSSTRR